MAVSIWRSVAGLFRRNGRPATARTRSPARGSQAAALHELEPRQLLSSTTVFADGFEGSSATLSGWTVRSYSGGTSSPTWGPSTVKAFTGSRSAFVAGSAGLTRNTYANSQHTGLVRDHLSLKNFGSASLTFKYFLNTEAAYDALTVLVTDNTTKVTRTVFRDSGDDTSANWQAKTIDLSPFAGRTDLSLEFRFDSDSTVVRDAPSGVWVDDVRLTGDTRPATATVKGALFEDTDGDHVRDPAEKPLAGWTVYLDRNQNHRRDSNETWQKTDGSGRYAFTGLSPGTYYVAAEPKPGYAQTSPTPADVRQAGAFDITLHFQGDLSSAVRNALSAAARRWERVIVGDLPNVQDDGRAIDDILIEAAATDIDGPGGVLAQASPSGMRDPALVSKTGPNRAGLPYRGSLEVDMADLAAMQRNGTLVDVLTHEMAHTLGFGTLWEENGLVKSPGSDDPRFTGPVAVAQYNAVFGTSATSVPIEGQGGPGTEDSHWRESVFGNEVMTGFVNRPPNRISAVTVGSLADLGYVVDLAAAEAYVPPGGRPIPAPVGIERPVTVLAGQTRGSIDFGFRATNSAPVVGALSDSPDPVVAGNSITLKATGVTDPDGPVAEVGFYRETNGVAGLQFGAGGDTLVGTDRTSADGFSVSVSTAGLAPGTWTYYAVARDVAGAASPGGTSAPSTKNTVQPQPLGRISGSVYHDANGNGARDTGEGPATGVTAYIDANGNDRLDSGERSVATDAAGNYAFAGLGAGTYAVRIVPPLGMVRTVPLAGKHVVTLSAGQSATGFNFGVTAAASITGRVYDDANGDGARQTGATGEAGLATWIVFDDTDNDGVRDAGEPSATTGPTGTYTLANLRPGRHTVRVILPTGWRLSAPAPGSYAVTLAPGQKSSGSDFGATRTGAIRGAVYEDANDNGVRDATDPGLAGRRVYLDANNNGVFDSSERSVLTDASGAYRFEGLAAATYLVREVVPDGWSLTTSSSQRVVLSQAQVVTNRFFGNRKTI